MPAKLIDCVSVGRDVLGRRTLTHVGGAGWRLSVGETVQAIRSGRIFFVTVAAESYIVSIGTASDGTPFLRTALGEEDSSMLLRLPECGPVLR